MAIIGGVTREIPDAPGDTDWRSLVLLYSGNVLFAAGLFAHAFLFNFYLRELQLPASVMGHQVAAMTLGGLSALLPAGVVIDRVGVRTSLLVGVLITAIGLALTAIAREVSIIYSAAFLVGLGGAACRVAWGPAMMRMTTPSSRSRAFTWNVAILIGTGSGWTYLSGLLPSWGARLAPVTGFSANQTVLLAGALVTAAAALCYGWLRLPPLRSASVTATSGVVGIFLPRTQLWAVAVIAFWMVAAALVLPFFNIFFTDRFGISVAAVGNLFAVTQVVTAIALVGAAELARRWGPRAMLLAWIVASPPALLWLAHSQVLTVAMVLYFVQGLIGPATNPLIDQLLLERAPRERHGIVAGWRNAAAESAGAVGASGGGKLIEAGAFSLLFAVAGVVAAASAVLLALVFGRRGASATPVADREIA